MLSPRVEHHIPINDLFLTLLENELYYIVYLSYSLVDGVLIQMSEWLVVYSDVRLGSLNFHAVLMLPDCFKDSGGEALDRHAYFDDGLLYFRRDRLWLGWLKLSKGICDLV